MKVEFESDHDRLGKVQYALAHCPVQPAFRLSYTVKEPEAAKNELLGKAVTDAKTKAAVLTQTAGVALKDIQSIDYSWDQIIFVVQPMNRMLIAEECCDSAIPEVGSYDMGRYRGLRHRNSCLGDCLKKGEMRGQVVTVLSFCLIEIGMHTSSVLILQTTQRNNINAVFHAISNLVLRYDH